MNEEEYVHIIKVAARDYLAALDDPNEAGSKYAIDRWGDVKTALSAHTFIRMCDAWLEKHYREEDA